MQRALHLASALSLLLLAQCAKGSAITKGGAGNDGQGAQSSGGSANGGAGNTGNTGGSANGGAGNSGNTGGAGNSGNTGNAGGAGNSGNTGGAGNSGNTGNAGGAGNSGNSGQGGAGNSGNSGQGGAGNAGPMDCNPLNPGAVCTPAEHCFPMPNGVPVCQGPVGPGGNYSACLTAADCQAAYECIDTGDVFLSPCCLEWCISGADCPQGATCEYLSTPVYVGGTEYGVCYDGLGGC